MKVEGLISECTAYDFKLKLEEKRPKSWLKSVCAFANGLGGSLFFGIDNDVWLMALKMFNKSVKARFIWTFMATVLL